MAKKKPIKAGLVNTVKEFTQNSTVHGIGYIFSKGIPLADSIFWTLLSLGSLSLAIYMSADAYLEWQTKPTITTLANSSVPATEITFPAVTICRDGVDMKAVEEAIFEDFTKWKQDNHKISRSKKDDEDLLHQYMEVTYAVKGKRSIFDLVKAHLSPDSSESSMAGAILENLKACEEKDKKRKKRSISTRDARKMDKKETKREKRSTNEEVWSTVTFLLSHLGNKYYKVEVNTSGSSSLSPGLISSTCQDVGMVPVCSSSISSSTSSSEACMLTTVIPSTFEDAICNGTTTSCQENTFLFSSATSVCLAEALGSPGSCQQPSQAPSVLCVTPTGNIMLHYSNELQ